MPVATVKTKLADTGSRQYSGNIESISPPRTGGQSCCRRWGARAAGGGREPRGEYTMLTTDRRRLSLLNRRAFLRSLGVGGVGLLAACQSTAAPRPATAPPPAAGAAPGTASAAGAPSDWEARWNALVAAAKQEGQLVIHGPPTPDTRQMVPEAFTRRVGIPVEYNGLRTSELAAKMVTEKQVGLVTIDAMLTGLTSYADILYPAGMLADLRSQLILPEVTDPSVWIL